MTKRKSGEKDMAEVGTEEDGTPDTPGPEGQALSVASPALVVSAAKAAAMAAAFADWKAKAEALLAATAKIHEGAREIGTALTDAVQAVERAWEADVIALRGIPRAAAETLAQREAAVAEGDQGGVDAAMTVLSEFKGKTETLLSGLPTHHERLVKIKAEADQANLVASAFLVYGREFLREIDSLWKTAQDLGLRRPPEAACRAMMTVTKVGYDSERLLDRLAPTRGAAGGNGLPGPGPSSTDSSGRTGVGRPGFQMARRPCGR
jgi:formiminotetrahydrofolate cyclodeaminase